MKPLGRQMLMSVREYVKQNISLLKIGKKKELRRQKLMFDILIDCLVNVV